MLSCYVMNRLLKREVKVMTLDPDVARELGGASGGWYNPKDIAVNSSEEIIITRYAKNMETKYPIKDKAGISIGYGWRFFLEDGRAWDLSNNNRKIIMAGLHPDGQDKVVPGRFKLTNTGERSTKKPTVTVEFVGSVTGTDKVEF